MEIKNPSFENKPIIRITGVAKINDKGNNIIHNIIHIIISKINDNINSVILF